MRHGIASHAAMLILVAAAGCASTGASHNAGAVRSGGPAADSTAIIADSLGLAALEDLFATRHAALAERIEDLESSPALEPHIIEARSILAEAEVAYLRGRITLALKLLGDAERILRQGS